LIIERIKREIIIGVIGYQT